MRRRVLALILALTLLCGVVPTTALAAFSDVLPTGSSYSWAYGYIEDMTARGFYQGYNDGTFRPGDELSFEQAYALAVRLCGFSADLKDEVRENYEDILVSIFDTDRTYFFTEFALAIELGLVTPETLAEQYTDGSLAKPLTREQFSRILVTAMQLLPPITGWKLEFEDAASVDRNYGEYVYTLSSLGIVVGDTNRNFNPKSTIRRADSATMLSRAIEYIESNGIEIELFNYTDYTAVSGSIVNAVTATDGSVTLTLERDNLDDLEVVIPVAARIYEHNVLTARSALENGRFCRVLSNKGGVFAVRLYAAPMRYTGSIREIGISSITIDTGTATYTFGIDRLTVATKAGGLDGKIVAVAMNMTSFESSDYVTAECNVDETGRLVSLNLIGGTRFEIAIFRKLENGVIFLDDYAGIQYELKLAAGAAIELDHAKAAANTDYTKHSGRLAWLVIDNISGEVTVLDIDTKTSLIQGGMERVTTRSNANSVVTISDPDTGRETGYVVTPGVKAYFDGKQIALQSLEEGSFVTVFLDGGNAKEIFASTGTHIIEGELSYVGFGTTITLDITKEDGTTETLKLNPAKLPPVKRAGKTSSVDKLAAKDAIVVTVTYNRITLIEALPATADVKATVNAWTMDSGGTSLTVTLEDGSIAHYTLAASGVSITQDGKTASLTSIKSGTKVALVLSGNMVSAIEIEGQTVTSGELSGVIKYINNIDRTMLIEVEGEIRTVSVPTTVSIIDAKGKSFGYGNLAIDLSVQIMGEYDASGAFVATLIIVK